MLSGNSSPTGEMLSVFLFRFFVSGSAFFVFFGRFSLLRVAVWNKFSGANFCFWVSMLVLCFSVVFCLCFALIFWRVAPETA